MQNLKEQHQKEILELNETILSGSEKEKLTLMFEIQGLKEHVKTYNKKSKK